MKTVGRRRWMMVLVLASVIAAHAQNGAFNNRDTFLKEAQRIRSYRNDISLLDSCIEALFAKYPPSVYGRVIENDERCQHEWREIFSQYLNYRTVVERDSLPRLLRMLPYAPRQSLSQYFYKLVQAPYMHQLVTADDIYPYGKAIWDELFTGYRNAGDSLLSDDEYRQKVLGRNVDVWLDWCHVLEAVGKSSEAMALLDSLYGIHGASRAELNAQYVAMLHQWGRDKERIPVIKAALAQNTFNEKMLGILKEDYVRQHNTEVGFDDYVHSMRPTEHREQSRNKVLDKLMCEPLRLFCFDRLDGGRVDMADYADCIIVIDFWATWCGPCKAAMPGMQMAVNRYKADPKVKFLFVSTMENKSNYLQTIKDFIQSKQYTFDVVLDEPDANGKRNMAFNTYAHQFHFSGIPQKLIIDGNGNLRWHAAGYGGSPSALADEISDIIEYLKQEPSEVISP